MAEHESNHWALSAVVSEEFLNTLARNGIGDGIAAAEFRQQFHLPMMGSLDLSIAMVIVEVRFEMRETNDDRLHAIIRATGDIGFHGETMMPALPGLARVRGEVLVRPRVELRPDGRFVAILDLAGSELIAMTLEAIDGIEANAEAQAQMGQLLFAAVGGELFEGLAGQLGSIGLELGPTEAHVLTELGVRPSPADVRMSDGSMTVGLPAVAGLEGNAHVQMGGAEDDGGGGIGVRRIGSRGVAIGVAAGALGALATRLAADTLGVPLPFEVDVIARDDRVGTRFRNQRLVESSFLPDLRPGLRSTVRTLLVGDQLELSLREAWVELPLVPPAINRLNRWFGGVAALAPLNVSIPARGSIPVRPDSEVKLDVRITELDVGRDGVTFVVEAHL